MLVQDFELDRLLHRIGNVADHPGLTQTMDDLQLRHRDGTIRWADATLTNPSGQWGDAIVLNVHDVTKQRELEEQLRHDALHDPLTGLWNRPAFTQYAEKACLRASRERFTLALLFVDLDGFKQVNDTLGHGLGDEVLVQVGKRLRGCLRGTEVLARLGGDEFTVLVERVSSSRDAIDIADRIHADADPSVRRTRGPAAPRRERGHRVERERSPQCRRAAAGRGPRHVLGEALRPIGLEARRPGRRREPGGSPVAAWRAYG